MEIEFIGHAGFRINNIAIDPWLSKFTVSKQPEAIILTLNPHNTASTKQQNKISL
jgi:L-ascorbate metabolism protein UlaG (beta-lactamase superfamily)